MKRREVTAKEGEDGAAAAGSSSSPVPPEGGDGKAKKKRQFRVRNNSGRFAQGWGSDTGVGSRLV